MPLQSLFLKSLLKWIIFLFGIFCFTSRLWAQEIYHFGADHSTIQGSIQYSLVGQYKAHFEKFKGTIEYDPKKNMIRFVSLQIEAASVKSEFPRLDHIVCSSRLLDVHKYPFITFESRHIERGKDGFKAKGDLFLHGVKRGIVFPFKLEQGKTADAKIRMKVTGQWRIPRKDYTIIFNKLFDHGGILVGDYITVTWEVTAYREVKKRMKK